MGLTLPHARRSFEVSGSPFSFAGLSGLCTQGAFGHVGCIREGILFFRGMIGALGWPGWVVTYLRQRDAEAWVEGIEAFFHGLVLIFCTFSFSLPPSSLHPMGADHSFIDWLLMAKATWGLGHDRAACWLGLGLAWLLEEGGSERKHQDNGRFFAGYRVAWASGIVVIPARHYLGWRLLLREVILHCHVLSAAWRGASAWSGT
jgi:hypothetical protein